LSDWVRLPVALLQASAIWLQQDPRFPKLWPSKAREYACETGIYKWVAKVDVKPSGESCRLHLRFVDYTSLDYKEMALKLRHPYCMELHFTWTAYICADISAALQEVRAVVQQQAVSAKHMYEATQAQLHQMQEQANKAKQRRLFLFVAFALIALYLQIY